MGRHHYHEQSHHSKPKVSWEDWCKPEPTGNLASILLSTKNDPDQLGQIINAPTSSPQKLNFTDPILNQGNFNEGLNKYEIPEDGIYEFTVEIDWEFRLNKLKYSFIPDTAPLSLRPCVRLFLVSEEEGVLRRVEWELPAVKRDNQSYWEQVLSATDRHLQLTWLGPLKQNDQVYASIEVDRVEDSQLRVIGNQDSPLEGVQNRSIFIGRGRLD